MDIALINPNQLRHFGTQVQDNPVYKLPLSIISEDNEFSMNLKISGTIVFADTFTPSEQELATCPKIHLISPTPWDPHKVTFATNTFISLDEAMAQKRQVSMTKSSPHSDEVHGGINESSNVFNLTYHETNMLNVHHTRVFGSVLDSR